MNFSASASDALNIRNIVAKSFSIKEATTDSTTASRAQMSTIFTNGVTMVKNGSSLLPKDPVLIKSIRDFADKDALDRVLTIRNYFLKAIMMTFPNIKVDTAVNLASVKALVSYRESAGTVSWVLETGVAYTAGASQGFMNMSSDQRYRKRVSGTGLIQWTADRQINFLNRMNALKGNGFTKDLAFIDPGFQAVYWAAELAEKAGMNKEINSGGHPGGAFFSSAFADVLRGKADASVGEIYGAFMLWQMGGKFGLTDVRDRNALIYGDPTFTNVSRNGGLTAYDLNKGWSLGLTGYYPKAATLTVTDFCAGISKFVRKGKTFPFNYKPKTSYFYKGMKVNPVTKKKVRNIFAVEPNQDLLEIFNLK